MATNVRASLASVRKMDLGRVAVAKAPLPENPLESDPNTTDTMQEDPTVDGLQKPQPFGDIMRNRPAFQRQNPSSTPVHQDVDPIPASELAANKG